MSTMIEKRVGWLGNHIVYFAYGLMLLTLGAFSVWSWRDYRRHRDDLKSTRATR